MLRDIFDSVNFAIGAVENSDGVQTSEEKQQAAEQLVYILLDALWPNKWLKYKTFIAIAIKIAAPMMFRKKEQKP